MSLRLRLALWYGALSGAVVLVCSILIYAVHSRSQYDHLDRLLLQAAEYVVPQMQTAPADARDTLAAIPPTSDVVVRVYDGDGMIVASTPNAPVAPPLDPRTAARDAAPSPFDPVVGLAPSQRPGRPSGAFGILNERTGPRWRVYVVPVAGGERYVVTAASLDRIDASVVDFRRLVPLVSLLGAGMSIALGWAIAGGALHPVAALTRTAATIARSRNLEQRVPMAARRDELARMAATFNEMIAALQQTAAAQQRFIADASHELRAPLTAIQANLELLARQPDMSTAQRQEAISEAGREAGRLAPLVADLLTLARSDAGVALRRQPVELDRVVLDAFSEARLLARGQRLRVESVQPMVVEGDPDRLRQLVLAVLDNALKYTPADGQVTLGLRRDGEQAVISIRDTGIGITPEDLPRVFDRFYRADPARTRDPGGTGLGLPIARWIAREHGGELTLASAIGCGTEAVVRLPLPAC